MSDFSPGQTQVPVQTVKKPFSVTIFGILNIVIGCYQLIRILPGSYKITARAFSDLEGITVSRISFLLILVVGIGLSIWLLILGIGLLKMKRWARRGSVIYAWIQIVFIVITLGSLFVSLLIGWTSLPKDGWAFFNVNNCIALISWIYMVLLLIFMKATKVKRAFAAAGEYV
jgi:hypothetical protein